METLELCEVAGKKFTVATKDASVKVLGTKFNVISW